MKCQEVYADKQHVTKKLTWVRLNTLTGRQSDGDLCLLDTWGWSSSNYASDEFKQILKGQIKDGFKMEDNLTDDSAFRQRNPTLEQMVHGCIFIIPADQVEMQIDPGNPFYERLRKFKYQTKQCDVNPTIMLSKVDVSDQKLINDYQNAFQSQTITTLFSRMFDFAGFDGTKLFPGKNYSILKQRDAHIECCAMMVLLDALQQSQIFKKNYQEKKKVSITDEILLDSRKEEIRKGTSPILRDDDDDDTTAPKKKDKPKKQDTKPKKKDSDEEEEDDEDDRKKKSKTPKKPAKKEESDEEEEVKKKTKVKTKETGGI